MNPNLTSISSLTDAIPAACKNETFHKALYFIIIHHLFIAIKQALCVYMLIDISGPRLVVKQPRKASVESLEDSWMGPSMPLVSSANFSLRVLLFTFSFCTIAIVVPLVGVGADFILWNSTHVNLIFFPSLISLWYSRKKKLEMMMKVLTFRRALSSTLSSHIYIS